jgi:putative holliday junction resolvase
VARILALDVGDKRIGLALSDTIGILASPFSIVQRVTDEQAIDDILKVVREKEVGGIIAGLPCAPDGGIGLQAAKVQLFIDLLREKIQVPIIFHDERYSTNTAKRLKQENSKKKLDRKTRYDSMAAAVILQEYLDEKINEKNQITNNDN